MEKEVLLVNQKVSKSLSKVKTVFRVLAVTGAILGLILFIGGIAEDIFKLKLFKLCCFGFYV